MTYKQIEASREARLWITQVIIPTVSTVGVLLMIPEVRTAAKTTVNEIKQRINAKKK